MLKDDGDNGTRFNCDVESRKWNLRSQPALHVVQGQIYAPDIPRSMASSAVGPKFERCVARTPEKQKPVAQSAETVSPVQESREGWGWGGCRGGEGACEFGGLDVACRLRLRLGAVS